MDNETEGRRMLARMRELDVRREELLREIDAKKEELVVLKAELTAVYEETLRVARGEDKPKEKPETTAKRSEAAKRAAQTRKAKAEKDEPKVLPMDAAAKGDKGDKVTLGVSMEQAEAVLPVGKANACSYMEIRDKILPLVPASVVRQLSFPQINKRISRLMVRMQHADLVKTLPYPDRPDLRLYYKPGAELAAAAPSEPKPETKPKDSTPVVAEKVAQLLQRDDVLKVLPKDDGGTSVVAFQDVYDRLNETMKVRGGDEYSRTQKANRAQYLLYLLAKENKIERYQLPGQAAYLYARKA